MKSLILALLCVCCACVFGADGGWTFPTADKKSVTLKDVPDWGTEGFTLEVWCRPDEEGCGYAVLLRGAFGYPNFFGGGKDINFYLVNTEGKNVSSRVYTPLELGKYHHYVMSCSKEQCELYRDGKMMRKNKGNCIPKYVPSTPIHIGNSIGWVKKNFVGVIGLVRIYGKTLSAQDVKANFEKLQKEEALPTCQELLLDEDRRFGEKKKIVPGDLGKSVETILDNKVFDRRRYEKSRHVAGREAERKPLVDFEDIRGWKVKYVSGEVEPVVRLSQEMPLWGDKVLRLEFKEGVAPKAGAEVVLEPPQPILIPNEFDAVSIWRFATKYGKVRPALHFSVQWKDEAGELHDSGKLGGMLEVGWGLKMNPLKEKMKAGCRFVSITFTGFNEPERVIFIDNLCFYERSKKALPDARVPSYAELGVPNRPETVQPTSAEPCGVALEAIGANHWRFTSTGEKSGKKLLYDIRPATGTFSDIQATWNGRTFTPMQGGGLQWALDNEYPVKAEALLPPASPKVAAKLANASVKGNTLVLDWEYVVDKRDKRTAQWKIALRDNTLVLDLASDLDGKEGHAGEVIFGGISGISGKVVEIPYLTWGRWMHQSNPPGIFAADNCYVFAMLDWYNSDASGLFGASSATPGGHYELRSDTADHRWVADKDAKDPTNTVRDYSVINGGSYYWPTTAGVRNPVRERIMLTVAGKLENVLPNIPHGPNPDMAKTRDAVWATRMWYVNKPTPDYFDQELAMWRECRFYGMDKLFVRLHGNINRMYWPVSNGDPATFVMPFTTPIIGGDAALAKFFAEMKKLGYRIGIYTDPMLLSSLAREAWDEDMMNQDSNGAWLYSSGNTNQTKTSRMVALQAKWNAIYRKAFAPNCGYIDQITCPPCWRYTDYDARAPEAAKFSAAWRVFVESLRQERKDYGPIISEGKTQVFFAGLCDSYAQTQRMRMNVIPDFNLRKIHPLSNDCGAELGWINYKGSGGEINKWAYKLLALEYAYGNIGHIASCYHGAPLVPVPGSMIRSYFLVQPMQKYYADVKIKEILYNVNGAYLPFEEAVRQGTLGRNQVKLVYENGFEAAANLNETENMDVTLNGRAFTLPPEGFAAMTADGSAVAYSALQEGRRVDMCRAGDLLYCDNGPGEALFKGKGAYIVRRQSRARLEILPAPFKGEETVELAFPGKQAVLEKYAKDGALLGTEKLPIANGRLSIPVSKDAARLVVHE